MDEPQQQPALSDPEDAFQRMLSLLQAKDDTSRFVGLALLKSVLDNQIQLRENPERIQTLWESLSPKFLDRLLRAGQNQKLQKTESRDMIDLAVAVLHTFAVLLPTEARVEKRLIGRTGPLVNSLVQSSPETTTLILQTLLTIVSHLEGALELLKIEDLSPLIEIAPQQPLALDILYYTWSNASAAGPTESHNVIQQVNDIVPKLLLSFKGTDAVTLLSFMGKAIPKLNFETTQKPKWLRPLIQLLRKLVTSRPTLAGRTAYTTLAAAVVQVFPEICPQLLFKDDNTSGPDNRPFSYLFINLLLIDIRSSFPSLLSQINTPEYPAISRRLAAAFDVISAFIGYLVKSLDDENDNENSFAMAPDLLLKLRKDIAETMSLTIEYLRDRYDASIAGAAGLDPSARPGTSVTSSGTHLTLTWDTIQESNNVTSDSLILAGTRTLAIWLREDENENLRNESATLMDLFMDLYNASSSTTNAKSPQSSSTTLDFRYPILTALEGILSTEDGISAFLSQKGWSILSTDLTAIIRNIATTDNITVPSLSPSPHQSTPTISDAMRGIEIIRVLLLILDHESTGSPIEEWMKLVEVIASANFDSSPHHQSRGENQPQPQPPQHPIILEFQIALLQLATALFLNAGKGMVKRYERSLAAILGLARQVGRREMVGELSDEVEDLVLGLEGLR